jgi:hypothetical protein
MADEVFRKEWLADGRIACYRFVSTGSESAEKWFSEIVDLFQSWDASKPLLLMIDLSEPDNALSPEAMRAAREASLAEPDVAGKTAILVDSSASTHNVSALVDHVLAGTRERRIFSQESEAVAWLLEA